MPFFTTTSLTADRSKAFLFGLYAGLSLLIFLSWLDPVHDSFLHKASNIYGIQALAGGVLGLWLIWHRADHARATPAISSVWISMGLVVWTIGQALWIWAAFRITAVPYPWWSDLFYLASDLFWLSAIYMIYSSLDRPRLPAVSPFTKILIPIGISLLLAGVPAWIARRLGGANWLDPWALTVDFVYILLTCSSLMLAIGLVTGDNAEIPFPLHQCIRYLCAATAIDTLAVLTFSITVKLPPTHRWAYYNGNWVDWLFLTAMYFWGASALKWPLRRELLQYTFQTRRVGARLEDIYRASEIAQRYSPAAPLTGGESIDWILEHIPACLKIVKLGNTVVGSTFLFPVPHQLLASLQENPILSGQFPRQIRTLEQNLFEEAKQFPITWDCLYLADASISPKHRRRGLAFRGFEETIEDIALRHPEGKIKVYCWPHTLETTELARKLHEHFEGRIPVIKIQ